MKSFHQSFLLFCALALASCSLPFAQQNASTPSSTESGVTLSDSGSSAMMPTRNVSYVGIIGELDSSVDTEGTHRLILGDGQFLLLQSTDANLSLNTYLGKRVEVRGSVQPTNENNGGILHVEEVTILESGSGSESSVPSVSSISSSSSAKAKTGICGGIAGIPCPKGLVCVDDPSDSCSPEGGGADCSGICVKAIEQSAATSSSQAPVPVPQTSSSKLATPDAASSVSSSAVSEKMMSSVSAAGSSALEPTILMMSKQNYADSSLWTQKYCTSHVAFCISAHKNWYFKSFGATTTNLWHVEFSMSPIEDLHTGPIVLNLVSGTVASMDGRDGQIKSQGSDIVGLKDWNGGTHFELIADARLKDAVAAMLRSITPYAPGE